MPFEYPQNISMMPYFEYPKNNLLNESIYFEECSGASMRGLEEPPYLKNADCLPEKSMTIKLLIIKKIDE